MSEKKPNLWWRWIADYWRDPRKVFEAQRVEDMWRKFFKLCWIMGAVYVLFAVAGPTNVKALQLWMEDDRLAEATAWAFTWMSFLAFSIVRFAAQGLAPTTFYIPLIPRKWHAEPLRIPPLTVLVGALLVLGLLYVQFTNAFNMYAHEAQKAGGAATTQLSAASSEVADLEAALAQVNAGEKATLARIDADLSRVAPEKTLTIRTLGAQRQDAVDKAAEERRRIQAELKEARRTNVTTTQTVSDPRPVDGYYAAMFGIDRTLMSALNDAQRSALVELLLVMGLGLGLVAATSKMGVREAAELRATTESLPEPEAPKADNVTPFPSRKKFLLPAGTVADEIAEAA